MRLLVIGGTGFIGRPLVRELARMGHEVAVLTRSSAPTGLPAESIVGERGDLDTLRPQADAVVDLILSSGAQAQRLMETFRGLARRVVAASSMDVYRACDILHGSEEGPLQRTPLTEDSELRSKLQTYPPESIQALRAIFPWLDDEYDKIPVERAILGDAHLSGTVLRLPMIYGPGDRLRRFHAMVKRIDDGRRRILLEAGWAEWRAPRGYVDNVAAAIALAAVSEKAAGRVYNVAEGAVVHGARVGRQNRRSSRMERRLRGAADRSHAAPSGAEGQRRAALGRRLLAHPERVGIPRAGGTRGRDRAHRRVGAGHSDGRVPTASLRLRGRGRGAFVFRSGERAIASPGPQASASRR